MSELSLPAEAKDTELAPTLSRSACSRRAASLRLKQNPVPLRGPWAFAFAPLHPRCSQRLRASYSICLLREIFMVPSCISFTQSRLRPVPLATQEIASSAT